MKVEQGILPDILMKKQQANLKSMQVFCLRQEYIKIHVDVSQDLLWPQLQRDERNELKRNC